MKKIIIFLFLLYNSLVAVDKSYQSVSRSTNNRNSHLINENMQELKLYINTKHDEQLVKIDEVIEKIEDSKKFNLKVTFLVSMGSICAYLIHFIFNN